MHHKLCSMFDGIRRGGNLPPVAPSMMHRTKPPFEGDSEAISMPDCRWQSHLKIKQGVVRSRTTMAISRYESASSNPPPFGHLPCKGGFGVRRVFWGYGGKNRCQAGGRLPPLRCITKVRTLRFFTVAKYETGQGGFALPRFGCLLILRRRTWRCRSRRTEP